ncbi:MAG: hypothetical protein JW809_06430 [Pirellulales bacterium]|nr:hypothetical protein [Pirellulales bacterium]
MRWPILWCVFAVVACCPAAAAQNAPPPSTPPSVAPAAAVVEAAPRPDRVEEAPLPLYYVEDEQGKLVPMFGFTFEDFMRAFRRIEGLAPSAPAASYVIERFSARGRVQGSRVELDVQYDLIARDEGRFRVPLRLGGAVARGPLESDPDVRAILEYDEQAKDYVCWARAKPDERFRLTLGVSLPVASLGGESCLRMRVPPAARCELQLTVPEAGLVGEVSRGATLETTASEDPRQTRFTAAGLRGDFELRWRKPAEAATAAPTVLDASGQIAVRIDDQSVHTEATLQVQGGAAPLDRFRIRLPAGSELLPDNPSDYRLVVLPPSREGAQTAGPLVEARLAEPTAGPVTVRLATRRPLLGPPSAEWQELGGFEVIGAARQSGRVAVEVRGDLFVSWDPRQGVRQVEALPESATGADYTAGFEYVAQPYSLRARIVPRKTHVNVAPEYVVSVDARQASLAATLRYTVRGRKAILFEVDMSGWEFDEVGPDNVVGADGAKVSGDGVLSVPLLQPSTGQIEITIKARQPIDAASGRMRLTFPEPRTGAPGPAGVAILPADNVRLVPDDDATMGLSRQETPPPVDLPKRRQPPLFYRGEIGRAVFVAEHSVHAQAISVGVTTRVALDDEGGRVEQRLAYTVEYEPHDRLLLEVPRSLAKSDATEFLLDAKRLLPTALAEGEPDASGDDNRPVRMVVALPEARMGRFDLIVRYPLPPRRLVPKSTLLRAIPLVMPLDGRLTANRVMALASAGLCVTHPQGLWKPRVASDGPGQTAPAPSSSLELTSLERLAEVELGVFMEARNLPDATVVQRAWLQTWLIEAGSTTGRQDRALFRFTTNRLQVALRLPEGTIDSETEIFLDGEPVNAPVNDKAVRLIALPRTAPQREHLLEVRCQRPGGWTPQGRFLLDPPQLGEQVWTRRAYWQVIVPPHVHLVGSPPGYVAECRWAWNGVFWGRQPLLDTPDLERWVGIEPSAADPKGANTYLLGTLGPMPAAVLRSANRSWIVLAASGAALVLGLVWIYVPVVRRGGVLWAAVVALAATTALWPAPTLLALQAASLGVALALVAGLLESRFGRRGPGRRGATGSVLDRDSTQTQYVTLSVPGENSAAASSPPGPATPSATTTHVPSRDVPSSRVG